MDANQELRETSPCQVCGQLQYEWGNAGPFVLEFYKKTDSWFPTGQQTVARLCQVCGNVQLFKKIPNYRKIDETLSN